MDEREVARIHERVADIGERFARRDDRGVVEGSERLVAELSAARGDAWLEERIAYITLLGSISLGRQELVDEAKVAVERLRSRFASSPDPDVRDHLARAMMNRANMLKTLKRGPEALTAFDAVIAAYRDDPDPRVGRRVAWAIWHKRSLLEELGRGEELADLYEELADRHDEGVEGRLDEAIIWALHQRATGIEEVQQIPVFDEIVRRFGDSRATRVRRGVVDALINKAVAFARLGETDAQLSAYDEVVSRFGEASEVDLREGVADALRRKAIALDVVGRSDEAADAFDAALAHVAAASSPRLIDCRADILISRGLRRGTQGDGGEAEAVVMFDSAVATCAEAARAARRAVGVTHAVNALTFKVDSLGRLRRSGEADAVLDQLVEALGDVAAGPPDEPERPDSSGDEGELARTVSQVFSSGECWDLMDPPRADAPSQEMIDRALALYRFTWPWVLDGDEEHLVVSVAVGLLRDIADGYALLSGSWSADDFAGLPLPQRAHPERLEVIRRFGVDEWLGAHGQGSIAPEGDDGDDDPWPSRPDADELDLRQFAALCASALHNRGLRAMACDSPAGRGVLGDADLRHFDATMLARARGWAGRLGPEHPLTAAAAMCVMVAQGLFISSHSPPTSSADLFPPRELLRHLLNDENADLRRRLEDEGVVMPAWLELSGDLD